jgi:hypothetical protein
VLLALFVSSEGGPAPEPMTLGTLARQLGVLYSLVSYGLAEIAVAAALAVTLLAAAALALRARLLRRPPGAPRIESGDGFLLATAVAIGLYFLVPAGLAGGGYVNQRLQLFVVFFLLLWLATRPELDRFRAAIVALGCALAVASAVIHGVHYARLGRWLDEYRGAAAALEPGSTVLPLSFDHRGAGDGRALSRRVFPFEHAGGRVAAQRRLIDLNSYQSSRGYFPIVYRSDCDPLRFLGTVDAISAPWPQARLDGYPEASGCRVDHVLLWAAGPEAHAGNELVRELDRSWERTFVSPRGKVEIYRRGGAQSSAKR